MYTDEQIKEINQFGLYEKYADVIKGRLFDAKLMIENAGKDRFEHFSKSIEAAKDHISKAEQLYSLLKEIEEPNHKF